LPLNCVNRGGPQSRIQLSLVPRLEQECRLAASAEAALDAWQARPGEILTALDPEATAYRVRLTGRDAAGSPCIPFERLLRPVESPLNLQIYQALPDRERFELVLQKLTELGVGRVVPMETARSTTRTERDAGQRKSHRWPDVILRAARQCRRASLPELCDPVDFATALSAAGQAELRLLLYEGEASWSFAEELARTRCQSVALLVGPEGGFAAEEVALAEACGVLPVSLGPRLMRTETAAIVAAALAQHLLGDLR